jgi:hypothetical protein
VECCQPKLKIPHQLIAEGLLKDRRCQPGFAPSVSKAGISPGAARAIAEEEHRMKDLTKIIVAGVGTAALAGGIGAGLAYADTPSDEPTAIPPTSSPTKTPTTKPDRQGDHNGARRGVVRRHLLARALHGEVTLAGEEHRVIVFQRREVEKVSRTSVTVKSNDGFVETYVLSDDTKVREKGEQAKLSDIDGSDRVLLVAVKDDATLNARRVIVRST